MVAPLVVIRSILLAWTSLLAAWRCACHCMFSSAGDLPRPFLLTPPLPPFGPLLCLHLIRMLLAVSSHTFECGAPPLILVRVNCIRTHASDEQTYEVLMNMGELWLEDEDFQKAIACFKAAELRKIADAGGVGAKAAARSTTAVSDSQPEAAAAAAVDLAATEKRD